MNRFKRPLIQLALAALVAAGAVPDGGNHHPKTARKRFESWGILTVGSLAMVGLFSGLRSKNSATSVNTESLVLPAASTESFGGMNAQNASALSFAVKA